MIGDVTKHKNCMPIEGCLKVGMGWCQCQLDRDFSAGPGLCRFYRVTDVVPDGLCESVDFKGYGFYKYEIVEITYDEFKTIDNSDLPTECLFYCDIRKWCKKD